MNNLSLVLMLLGLAVSGAAVLCGLLFSALNPSKEPSTHPRFKLLVLVYRLGLWAVALGVVAHLLKAF